MLAVPRYYTGEVPHSLKHCYSVVPTLIQLRDRTTVFFEDLVWIKLYDERQEHYTWRIYHYNPQPEEMAVDSDAPPLPRCLGLGYGCLRESSEKQQHPRVSDSMLKTYIYLMEQAVKLSKKLDALSESRFGLLPTAVLRKWGDKAMDWRVPEIKKQQRPLWVDNDYKYVGWTETPTYPPQQQPRLQWNSERQCSEFVCAPRITRRALPPDYRLLAEITFEDDDADWEPAVSGVEDSFLQRVLPQIRFDSQLLPNRLELDL